jgi:hypothetical protein
MVYKLAQLPPLIWMMLPVEAKKWILNERKCQQHEYDSKKWSLSSGTKYTIKIAHREKIFPIYKPICKSQNSLKGEEELQADKYHTHGLIDEYLEEAINTECNAHTNISIENNFYNKFMNLLFFQESYHSSILDGGADTYVLVKGWEVLSIHNSRRPNVVSFDH